MSFPIVPVALLAAVLAPLLIQAASRTRSPPMPDQYAESTLTFTGLDCAVWCPIQVHTALQGFPGVLDSSVDVRSGQVKVRYDQRCVTETQIVAQLEGGEFHFMGTTGRSVQLRWNDAIWTARWRAPGPDSLQPGRLTVGFEGSGCARVRVEIEGAVPRFGPTLDLDSVEQRELTLEIPPRPSGQLITLVRLHLLRNGQQSALELPFSEEELASVRVWSGG